MVMGAARIEQVPNPITREGIFFVFLYFVRPAGRGTYQLSTKKPLKGELEGWGGPPVQPGMHSKEEFYAIVEEAYKDSSPADAELLYGCVAEEQRKSGRPHYHMALMASKRHRWLPIAQNLREKRGINVDVSVWHPSYASQYNYLRLPTMKKPMSHLDDDPYMSPAHPRGDTLKAMLRKAEQTAAARMAKKMRNVAAAGEEAKEQPNKRARALQFCDVVDIVKRNRIHSEGHLWEVARQHVEKQHDCRLANWANRQRHIPESLRKAQDFLTSSAGNEGGNPGEICTTAKFTIDQFEVPRAVTSWLQGGKNGYHGRALVLGGKAGAGKTQMLRAICIAKGWPFIFASTIDELRGVRVPPNTAVIVGDFDCKDQHPNWIKHTFDIENARTVKVRYSNVTFPAGAIRMVSTNACKLNEFLPAARNEEDRRGMARRVRFVEVKNSLVRKMERGNPKSLEVTRGQGEGSEGIKQPIAGEFKGEPTERRASNKDQKEVLEPAEKKKGMARQPDSDDERRGTNREPAEKLAEQNATNDDVKEGCVLRENQKATAERTGNDGGRQRADIEVEKEEGGNALKTQRTEEIRTMTLQNIMEWKKNGWLNDDEFCRLKAAWFKSACV